MTSFMPIDSLEIKRRSKFGHASIVYVIATDENGPTKIGKTCDIVKRVCSFQTGNALPLTVFATRLALPKFVPAGQSFSLLKLLRDETDRLEKAIHAELNAMGLMLMGEWFDVTAAEAIAVVEKVAANIRLRAISKTWLLTDGAKLDPEIGFMRDELLRKASAAEAQAVKANSVGLTAFRKTGNLSSSDDF